jgi:Domain of unknown function (DUF2017)
MSGIGAGGFPADDDDRAGADEPFGANEPDGLGEDDSGDDSEELAATFRPIPGGATCYFAPAQAGVIRSLVGQVAELVRGDSALGDNPLGDSGPGDSGPGDSGPGGSGPGGSAMGDRPGAGGPGAGGPADASGGGLAGPGAAGPGGAGSEEAVPGTPSPDELERMLGLSGNVELPDDPVLARLLPDAYSDDPDASAEFRRYTEESLRAGKISSARAVLASLPAGGGDVVLSEPECQQWLKALNDVRLALGVRLGITDENEDLMSSASVDDPRSAYLWVYQWLAYLQDSLIESLS